MRQIVRSISGQTMIFHLTAFSTLSYYFFKQVVHLSVNCYSVLCQGYEFLYWVHNFIDTYSHFVMLIPQEWRAQPSELICLFINTRFRKSLYPDVQIWNLFFSQQLAYCKPNSNANFYLYQAFLVITAPCILWVLRDSFLRWVQLATLQKFTVR